jgi:hemerythrin superfamily protein
MTQVPEQKHPREKQDRAIIEQLFQEDITDHNLAELARLRIRYKNFPGAKSLQQDLDLLLQQWNLTEEALFEKTRQIHHKRKVYNAGRNEEEDWS